MGRRLTLMTAVLAAAWGTRIHRAQAAPPARMRVWTADVLSPWRDFLPPGPGESPKPIAIVGTPGGSFSGKAVVASAGPIRGLRAEMSALRGRRATIPASAVQVRYARYVGHGGWHSVAKAVAVFDALEEAPPKEVGPVPQARRPRYWEIGEVNWDLARQPIWVTVHLPRDAAPGDYEGALTVTVEGAKPVAVPVKLTVCGWRLPEPDEWLTFVEFIQSPESVALRYGVPLWSDAHVARMAKSLALLRRAGNRSVYVPLICGTNQGNAESMVRWIKRGREVRHDFTVLEKYLDAVERHMGRPRNVVLYVWDIFLEGGSFTVGTDGRKTDLDFLGESVRQARQARRGKGPEVTAVTPGADGPSRLQLPEYSDPEARALWKPLTDELRRRLKKRGLDGAVTLGAACDHVPSKGTVALFADLLPGVPWMEHTHGFYSGPRTLQQRGGRIKYLAIVFFNRRPASPRPIYALKPHERRVLHYPRGRPANDPVTDFRLTAELHTGGGLHGFGRVGADFWPVLKDKRGRMRGRICGRFPESQWRNLDIRTSLLHPGPEGAVATVRFEMMIEGTQENEARLFVERALFEKRIDGDLAERCRAVLAERVAALKRYRAGAKQNRGVVEAGYRAWIASWQERSKRLYDLAAEVAGAIDGERTHVPAMPGRDAASATRCPAFAYQPPV